MEETISILDGFNYSRMVVVHRRSLDEEDKAAWYRIRALCRTSLRCGNN